MKTNDEMIAEIISSVEYHCKKSKRNKKVITTFIAVISILACLGTGVGAAIHSYPVFSRGWADQMKEKAVLASGQEAAEEFRSRMAQTDDIFSEKANETHYEVIMDYDSSVPVNLTEEADGLTYNFKSITKGEFLRLALNGSIADPSAEFQYLIVPRYYAIIEISRTDKAALKEEDMFGHFFMQFVSGYNPYTVNMCLQGQGGTVIYTNYTIYCALDITDQLIFADNDLYIALSDFDGGFDIYEHIYANKKGDIILKDNAPEHSVMFCFNPGKEFADKKAVKQYLKEYPIINKDFDGYTK